MNERIEFLPSDILTFISIQSTSGILEWILATGFWNDGGAWDDTANWIDSI